MPLTVITVKNVPASLRGDLTKWMQEIATGVYVGNFNTRIREKLWERVQANVKKGEATISYAAQNEIGYRFDTLHTQRTVIDFDGIPLVYLPNKVDASEGTPRFGYSNAAKYRRITRFDNNKKKTSKSIKSYVIVDIETDGLSLDENTIIEIGAIKITPSGQEEFNELIKYPGELPSKISKLTGISQVLLDEKGQDLKKVLSDFLYFIGDLDLVGYGIDFDFRFINNELKKLGLPLLTNKTYDIMKYVKSEKLFLDNYQLQTVLKVYDIDGKVPHRALQDAHLIHQLSEKVNKFWGQIN